MCLSRPRLTKKRKGKRETAITFQWVVDSKWETRENICWMGGSWRLGVTQVQSSLSVLLRLEGGSMSSQDVPGAPDGSKKAGMIRGIQLTSQVLIREERIKIAVNPRQRATELRTAHNWQWTGPHNRAVLRRNRICNFDLSLCILHDSRPCLIDVGKGILASKSDRLKQPTVSKGCRRCG